MHMEALSRKMHSMDTNKLSDFEWGRHAARAWLIKLLLNLSRDFEAGAYKVSKQ
jgi:hypothetical protein